MNQYPVVKAAFSDGRRQFADFFLSKVLAYRFGKQHHFTNKEVSPEMISDVDYRMLFV